MKTAAYALFLLGTLFFAAPRADGQETLARLETNKLKIYFLGGERFFTIAVTPKAKALEDGAKL
ncbi:MAG TPA: hypothetical protein PLP17_03435, partial [Oligoflexia bacterium]|nr:hypothetical protein [Oligoflexia bacterium]